MNTEMILILNNATELTKGASYDSGEGFSKKTKRCEVC